MSILRIHIKKADCPEIINRHLRSINFKSNEIIFGGERAHNTEFSVSLKI